VKRIDKVDGQGLTEARNEGTTCVPWPREDAREMS
jgi:hypothetical protein